MQDGDDSGTTEHWNEKLGLDHNCGKRRMTCGSEGLTEMEKWSTESLDNDDRQ